MANKLTRSSAHKSVVRPDKYHLALAFFRLGAKRRDDQIPLAPEKPKQ